MGFMDIYEILKNNPGKEFNSAQLKNMLNISKCAINNNLTNIRSLDDIKVRLIKGSRTVKRRNLYSYIPIG